MLCSSLFSVLESVGLWVTAQDRISMLEGQATNEKVLSPLPQYQIRQLKTAAESSNIIGIIHVERLPRTLHSSCKFIRQVYHGLPVWMGSLLLWSMTWMHDVACVSRVVLFDGHLGTSPYSPSSRQCHGGSRWYKLFPRSSMILHCFEIHGSYGLRMASARHGSMNLPWYSLSSTSLCGHLRRIILPLSATCLAFSLPFSLRRGDLATHWSLELPLSSPYGLDSGPPRLDYFLIDIIVGYRRHANTDTPPQINIFGTWPFWVSFGHSVAVWSVMRIPSTVYACACLAMPLCCSGLNCRRVSRRIPSWLRRWRECRPWA